MSGERKPTLKLLYYMLGSIAPQWYKIGEHLKIHHSKLDKIKADFETASCDRKLIELFDVWILSNLDCHWSTIIEALKKMDEQNLADKVSHYINELGTIENVPSLKHSTSFLPIKEQCYDEESMMQYFETDKLARASIRDSKPEFFNEVFKCLKVLDMKWYEMGIAIGMPKRKLNAIEMTHKPPSAKLQAMLSDSIEMLTFKFTWRMLIDALREMDFTSVADAVEDLVLNRFGDSSLTSKLESKEFKMSDFFPKSRRENVFDCNEKDIQKCITKIREILNLPISSVSDEDVLFELDKHIVRFNPSQDQLQIIAKNVEKISHLSNKNSKELTEHVKKLEDDLKTASEVIIQLKDEKKDLEISKFKLECNSRDIHDEMASVNESTTGDGNQKKAKLSELEERNQKVMKELQDVCEQLNDNIQKLIYANADYESIHEDLTLCRKKLYDCKRKLKACNKFVKKVQNSYPDISILPDIEDTIAEALADIEETDAQIDATQKILVTVKHPYHHELEKADPFRCHASGTGTQAADVGEKATAVVHYANFLGKPCKTVKRMEYEIVSEITGNKITGNVDFGREWNYEINYFPVVKGRHLLHITVNGGRIRGSPFTVAIKSSVDKLGDLIRTIEIKSPEKLAVNQRGEIFVTDRVTSYISVFNSSGIKLQSIEYLSSCGEWSDNHAIAVDMNDHIFVTDEKNHHIKKYASTGRHIATVETGRFCFKNPSGIAFNATNNKLYVTEEKPHVLILNSDLTFSGIFSVRGSAKESILPRHYIITCDIAGTIYVAEFWDYNIQLYTPDGIFLRSFNIGKNFIYGLAVDENLHIYVINRENSCHVFTHEGRFVLSFGGQFEAPQGIAVDRYGLVYVCDAHTSNIQIF